MGTTIRKLLGRTRNPTPAQRPAANAHEALSRLFHEPMTAAVTQTIAGTSLIAQSDMKR
jgi:hypothetical protein